MYKKGTQTLKLYEGFRAKAAKAGLRMAALVGCIVCIMWPV